MYGVNFCTNTIHHVLNGFFFLTTTTQIFSCGKKVFVREKSQSYTQCMYTGAHVAGVEDVVDEGDDDTFSHQTETERLPELPLV